jgi:hypothetical protein
MVQRRRFSAEYKREAVVMLNAQLSWSAGPPGTWGLDKRTRALAMGAAQAFPGQGHSRDEEVSQLRLSDQWNSILTDGGFCSEACDYLYAATPNPGSSLIFHSWQ